MTPNGGGSIRGIDAATQFRRCCCCVALAVLVACTGTSQDAKKAASTTVTPAATVASPSVAEPSTSPTTSAPRPDGCPSSGGQPASAGLEPRSETTAPPDTQVPRQARVTADYQFEKSLADSVGAAGELSAIGADATGFVDETVLGQTRPVLTFDRGSGLALTPASVVIGSEYTIELVFRFDRLEGWSKIVDFNDATEDCGLYSLDGRMDFWPITTGFGAVLEAGSYAHVVLTRDATGTVAAYVNGNRQLSFHDTGDIAVVDANDTLRLFSDDTVTPNEDSAGAVSRIRLYDGPLTASEVGTLAAEFPITAPTLADVDALLGEQADADRFSGAVLVTRHGEVLFSDAVGLADRDRASPNTLQTRFRIGSMNKMITAVAILQLVEAGKLELTAPVGDYLTDYPNVDVAATVTIHHLLTHTGGTGDIFGPTFDAHRDELRTHHDYVELYGARGPQFEPGTRWAYSNYGFVLLGAIIEAVTGQSYYDYVDDHIYQPAGMTATGSLPETEAVPDRSIGYTTPTPCCEWKPNTDTLPYRGTAAGGGYSTVEDLTRFAEALLNERPVARARRPPSGAAARRPAARRPARSRADCP